MFNSTRKSDANIGPRTRSRGPVKVRLNDYTSWSRDLSILREIKRCNEMAEQRKEETDKINVEITPPAPVPPEPEPVILQPISVDSDQIVEDQKEPAPVTAQIPFEEMNITNHPVFVEFRNDYKQALLLNQQQEEELVQLRRYNQICSHSEKKARFIDWAHKPGRCAIQPFAQNFWHALGWPVIEYTGRPENDDTNNQQMAFLFKKIMVWCHPDKNPPEYNEMATAMFKWLKEVQEILCDTRSRSVYNTLIGEYYVPLMGRSNKYDVNGPKYKRRYIPHGGVYNTDFKEIQDCLVTDTYGHVTKVYMPGNKYIASGELIEILPGATNLYSQAYNHYSQ